MCIMDVIKKTLAHLDIYAMCKATQGRKIQMVMEYNMLVVDVLYTKTKWV